jgi:hypothetical protein
VGTYAPNSEKVSVYIAVSNPLQNLTEAQNIVDHALITTIDAM